MFLFEEILNDEIAGCFRTKEEGWFENLTFIWTDFLHITEQKWGSLLKIKLKLHSFFAI